MNDIKMDTDVYEEIVGRIKSENNELLERDALPPEPDAEAVMNVVVPDYQVADEEIVDTINLMQSVFDKVVDLMNNIETNYAEQVDAKKAEELANASTDGPSDAATTGSRCEDSDE